MLNTISPFPSSRAITSHFALGLACASLASACSAYYPVGDSPPDQLLDGDSVANEPVADAQVGASLGPPDVTFSVHGIWQGQQGQLVSVGDVDGDGRDDVAIPMHDNDTSMPYIHLRYGAPRLRDAQEVFAFVQGGARLTMTEGLTVAAAGDVDADGYADVMIQTYECSVSTPGSGAYLIYGGPERLEGLHSLPSVAAARFVQAPRPGDTLSNHCLEPLPLSRPGDLDGDGIDDLVIDGSFQQRSDALDQQGVYLFYGRTARFSGELPVDAADARFRTRSRAIARAAGDINADGLGDLLVGLEFENRGTLLLAGRTNRWSGSFDLASSATLLEGAYVLEDGPYTKNQLGGDVDGDGSSDVLLSDADHETRYLFYGAPGLFDDGVDFSRADVILPGMYGLDETGELSHTRIILPVGDRDGDGDDELLELFRIHGDELHRTQHTAFSSGTRQRLSGVLSFPESEAVAQEPTGYSYPYPASSNLLLDIHPAGDLDGDGAGDLFSSSLPLSSSSERQLHIHYGTPAPHTSPITPVR